MSDLIRRDEALAGILNHYEVNNEIQNKEMDYIYNMVNNLRAVDAVEVVRCGECFYHKDSCFAGEGNIYCDVHMKYFPKDGFCSSGGRREDNAVD